MRHGSMSFAIECFLVLRGSTDSRIVKFAWCWWWKSWNLDAGCHVMSTTLTIDTNQWHIHTKMPSPIQLHWLQLWGSSMHSDGIHVKQNGDESTLEWHCSIAFEAYGARTRWHQTEPAVTITHFHGFSTDQQYSELGNTSRRCRISSRLQFL